MVLVNLWIPSPPTRAPKHNLSQLPQLLLLLLLPSANAHAIQSSNSAVHVVKGEEMKTQRKRGRRKHPKNRKNKRTNQTEEATVTNQWERRSLEIHEIHDKKILQIFSHPSIHHITQK
jgi:hypothetical protein